MLASSHRGLLLSLVRLSEIGAAVLSISAHTAGTLRSQTLHVKDSASVALSQKLYWIHYVTLGRVEGGRSVVAAALSMVCTKKNKEASVNISKTASPPKKHNASLWRLNVADCVCRRIWKERVVEGMVVEGVGECMWCLKSTWLWPKKKKRREDYCCGWSRRDDVTSLRDLYCWDGTQEDAFVGAEKCVLLRVCVWWSES